MNRDSSSLCIGQNGQYVFQAPPIVDCSFKTTVFRKISVLRSSDIAYTTFATSINHPSASLHERHGVFLDVSAPSYHVIGIINKVHPSPNLAKIRVFVLIKTYL
jgi:hypothetical protein